VLRVGEVMRRRPSMNVVIAISLGLSTLFITFVLSLVVIPVHPGWPCGSLISPTENPIHLYTCRSSAVSTTVGVLVYGIPAFLLNVFVAILLFRSRKGRSSELS
jgi:hypothetical protein